MNAAAADWLDMRRPHDDAARTHAMPLIAKAISRLPSTMPVRAWDIGAGTGNSAAWFDAVFATHGVSDIDWTLVDAHEPALQIAARRLPQAHTLSTPIAELSSAGSELAPPHILTASAVLDVLKEDDIRALVDLIVQTGALGWFVLNITGDWQLSPVAEADELIANAFAQHQRRDAKLGAQAPDRLLATAQLHGCAVSTAHSPWLLGADDGAFLRRFLSERVAAAVEEDPRLEHVAGPWLSARLQDPQLHIRVDHLDVLIVPPQLVGGN